ncbi:MAG: aldo/keto reductase [Candidatus Ornithomonoglobus sp.]
MYIADKNRYSNMKYNRCGRSGLKLSAFSLGLWHNFGSGDNFDNMTDMVTRAFDLGITHFDLANNYGPYPGSAEENFGKILERTLAPYRDELIISSKAGYGMWEGPYGDHGSRKYLIASCDQSLKRTGLEYFDIFYHHRPDPETPLEETAAALDYIVRSGRALYVGVSNYNPEQTLKISQILKELGTPLLIHQPRYNMLERNIENGLQTVLEHEGIGSISFCPLAQGLLTNKYLHGIPEGSRATHSNFLNADKVSHAPLEKINALNKIAEERGQTLAQMALRWNLRGGKLTSVLIGASRPQQIVENVKALDAPELSEEELRKIDEILG